MNIKRKFMIIGTLPIALSILIIFIVVSSYATISEIMKKDRIGEEIVRGVFDLNILTNEYIISLHFPDRTKRQWFAKHETIRGLFELMQFEGAEEKELLLKLRSRHQSAREHFLKLVEIYEYPERLAVLDADRPDYQELVKGQLVIESDSMVALTERLSDLNYSALMQYYRQVGIVTASSVLILMLLLTLLSLMAKRGILKPILKLHQATERIAAGELEHNIGIETSDEIGQLSRSFDDMTHRLRKSRELLEDEIAERRQSQAELERSRKELSSIYDAITDFLTVVDTDYRIIRVNRTVEHTWGTDLIGKLCYQAFQGRDEICPDCPSKRAMETKQPAYSIQKPPLEGIPTVEIFAFPILDPDGEVTAVVEHGKDITERVLAEQALKKEKEKLQKYLDISAVMVVMLDTEQKVTLINKKGCEILNCIPEEVIGENWFDNFLPEEIREDVKVVFNKLMAGEVDPVEYYENEVLTRNGEKRLIAWYNTVFRDEDGKITNTLGAGVDITDSRYAEMKMKASLKEKEVLLQEIHHRVKNNMTVISSLLQLQARKVKDRRYREMFEDSMSRIRTMALIHEKLYRSKDLARIDFSAYLSDMVDNIYLSYGLDHNTVKLKKDIGIIQLGIDRAIPCGLIVNELVSNSLKYAFSEGRSGEVWVSLHLNGTDQVEIKVGDNGIGMPQGSDIEETESLGLNLVNALVRQLQGEVELNVEKGTEFRITFKRT